MKINNILFPVDFSENSQELNSEVEWLAKRFHSKVTLLHVFETPVSWYGSGEAPLLRPDCFEQFRAEAQKRVAEYTLNLPEDQISRVTAEGDAAWQIKNWVEEHDVDLVMMGTHGYGAVRRLFLGSVAMKVLHDVTCPVWTQSRNESRIGHAPKGVTSIVCAVEPTAEALPLLRFIKELALQLGASVHLVHAVPATESRVFNYFEHDFHRLLMKSAGEEIGRLQREAGTDFPVILTDRPIAEGTATVAGDYHADLIVIGRGRTQDVFGTLRTHSYDILREAPCPVLSYCAEYGETGFAESETDTSAETLVSR